MLDLSPNEFLRLERLKKAAQLLKEGENRVNEICYMVDLILRLTLLNVSKSNLGYCLRILLIRKKSRLYIELYFTLYHLLY